MVTLQNRFTNQGTS